MELSKTEFKVCAYTASGYEVKETASKLFRSYHTIACHIKKVRVKNGLKNVAEITREFVLEFGDPRQYIIMFFLAIQIEIIYNDSGSDFRKSRRGKRIVRVKTSRKHNG